jgi:glycosyltransferase involved in cell wall biosynthesis
MLRIDWITTDNFIDVDLPVIKELSKDQQFDITWHIIFTKNRIQNFSTELIENSWGSGKCRIDSLYLTNRQRSLRTLVQLITYLLKIRRQRADLIYVDCEVEPYFTLVSKCILGSEKLIWAIHDIVPHVGVSKISHLFLNFKINSFKNFQVFSLTQKKFFEEKSGTAGRNIYYAPLVLKDFGTSTMEPQNDKIRFLFFGIIRQNKGLEYLINAANKLAQSFKGKFIVSIAGKCDDWTYYKKLITDESFFELSIGPVSNEVIPDLFCQSHYLVLPYRDVTQSGPLMIAYNYGIPVIASDLPGFAENIQNGKSGYLFEPENSDSLYDALTLIMVNHSADYQRMKLALESYVQENFKIEKITELYTDMFQRVHSNSYKAY